MPTEVRRAWMEEVPRISTGVLHIAARSGVQHFEESLCDVASILSGTPDVATRYACAAAVASDIGVVSLQRPTPGHCYASVFTLVGVPDSCVRLPILRHADTVRPDGRILRLIAR